MRAWRWGGDVMSMERALWCGMVAKLWREWDVVGVVMKSCWVDQKCVWDGIEGFERVQTGVEENIEV